MRQIICSDMMMYDKDHLFLRVAYGPSRSDD